MLIKFLPETLAHVRNQGPISNVKRWLYLVLTKFRRTILSLIRGTGWVASLIPLRDWVEWFEVKGNHLCILTVLSFLRSIIELQQAE